MPAIRPPLLFHTVHLCLAQPTRCAAPHPSSRRWWTRRPTNARPVLPKPTPRVGRRPSAARAQWVFVRFPGWLLCGCSNTSCPPSFGLAQPAPSHPCARPPSPGQDTLLECCRARPAPHPALTQHLAYRPTVAESRARTEGSGRPSWQRRLHTAPFAANYKRPPTTSTAHPWPPGPASLLVSAAVLRQSPGKLLAPKPAPNCHHHFCSRSWPLCRGNPGRTTAGRPSVSYGPCTGTPSTGPRRARTPVGVSTRTGRILGLVGRHPPKDSQATTILDQTLPAFQEP